MGMTAGVVTNKMCGKALRRKVMRSELVTVNNGATNNLLICLGQSNPSSRFVVERIVIVNEIAISNHTAGTLKLGHATATATFDDDSILTSYTLPQNATAKARTTIESTSSSCPSTLKTVQGILASSRPVIPSNCTVWATSTGMGTNGTGQFRYFLVGWELDDEQT